MEAVVTFVIAGLMSSLNLLKPFNPILGETYQGKFKDGTDIYTEYISHHPPIISYLLIGKDFRYFGTFLQI